MRVDPSLYPIKHASWFLHYIPSNMQIDSYIIFHQTRKLTLTLYPIKNASWYLRYIPSNMQVDAYIISHQTCKLILTLYYNHASWYLRYIPSNMQVDSYIVSHQTCKLILTLYPSNMQVDTYIISHQTCKLILTLCPIKHAHSFGVLCFVVNVVTHILRGWSTGTGSIVSFPRCQWSNPPPWKFTNFALGFTGICC